MKAFLSIAIFVIAYFFIATEKVNKTIVTILGACCVLFLNLVTFPEAVAAVDFNVIFLLVGMMTCVHILSKTGFFEWVAVSIAKYTKGNPYGIMVLLVTATAVLSSVLDNVTTIILLVPVTILIMQLLEIDPVPFIILEAIASNIGGTATLIGDPPNIIIGSRANLSFNDFLFNLGPVIVLVFAFFLLTIFLAFRNRFQVSRQIKGRVINAIPSLAITDFPRMRKALIILAVMFIMFFLHELIGLQPGVIALGGSMVMLLACRIESDETLMRVEWGVIFFFIGMFMIISALEVNGVMSLISNSVMMMAGKNLLILCFVVMWGAALLSSVLDNIPFVIAMVPLVKQFITHFTLENPGMHYAAVAEPLWWALALGACLGGNGTIIGSSANIIMAKISEKNECPVTFKRFFKYGVSFTIQSLLICSVYLWLRYF
ncbi:MAG: ArsB/NhaD family transporter [Candidatus Omnitrophica bacterium]|nr:ArsB/NhaD family transporter [Candidatus Omnitrophota bacterium]